MLASMTRFVTKNWRMTFRIDRKEIEIIDLDYEDYHEEPAMSVTIGVRLKNPAHPGSFIRHEIIEPLGLSVTGAAEVLGVTRATLSTLLNERAHLSPEMALRVEKAFGVSMTPSCGCRTATTSPKLESEKETSR